MQRTLIIYENESGLTEKIVKQMLLVIGPARCCNVQEFKEDYKGYDFFVIASGVENENPDKKILDFIIKNASWLINKKIGLLCTGVNRESGIRAMKKMQTILGTSIVHCKSIEDESRVEDIVKFSLQLKKIREGFLRTMPKDVLKKHIEEFLKAHNTCCLATGHGEWVRATPIEYMYEDNCIYILSEGGKKFANILLNDKVCITVYDKYDGMDKLAGMQIRGNAEIIYPEDNEYEKIINMRGLKIEDLEKLPALLNGIKVKFDKIEFLSSKFKCLGYDSKQIFYYR
ncbi:pyridoxamine 5'-phosphate oxidase family protein [Haloimpatiens sp. FM7330]|uniref:pyridoxamine 5'-phosphate oxidase family protein n=1 Tax=Haloimpatiens sp. FM7330 TaxID=3298610 RepID=UPI00363E8841